MAYGTTVRIEKFSIREGAVTGNAKQRFRVASSALSRSRAQLVDVEILSHPAVHRLPFERRCTRSLPPALARVQRRQQSVGYWSYREFALFDVERLVSRIQRTFASSAQWAWFCYASAHPERVAQQQTQPRQRTSAATTSSSTLHYLQQSSDVLDPCAFAYWVAGNLPLERSERLALLQLDSVAHLLRAELALLHQSSDAILCSGCGATLAHTRDIFSLTSAGAAGTFVNPSGIVFQILTLRTVAAPSVVVDNVQSTQDSWYPGYAWSIAYCSACFRHLGWQFDAVERSEDAGAPTRFFGFRRAALTQAFTGQSGAYGSEDDEVDDYEDYVDDYEDYEDFDESDASDASAPSHGDDGGGALVPFDAEQGGGSSDDDVD